MSNREVLNSFSNYLEKYDSNKPYDLPQRVLKSLKEVFPKKILIFNNKPLILYFEESPKLKIDEIFKKYFNFAESPIIFVETNSDIEIYNGFEYIVKNNQLKPSKLDTNSLNYYSLISGEYFKSDSFKSSKKRLDTVLLQNIKDARTQLLISLANHSLKDKLIQIEQTKDTKKKKKIFKTFTDDENREFNNINNIANALLGRIIFIRYLIDRKVKLFYKDKKQTITNDNLKDILSIKKDTYQFFKDLQSEDRGFNGDWFPIEEHEEQIVEQEHLDILKELISGTQMSSGQRSLFEYYDFSIIPIEFISNVYEHFIGEEKQKEDGAYYTPTFLVDYVLKYTIDEYFKKNPDEYNCKILDPACGSGIFLVEAFRKLVAQYEKVKNKKPTQEVLKQLVKDNIFGIDYNKSALQISVFSLYLAMLDYIEPKDIENFKFPYLTRDNPNFFNSDFFNEKAEFNDILKEKKLDFIIGNPPYGRGTIKSNSFANDYIKEEKLSIGNRDIIQPFLIRVKDFSHKNTQISFIVASKVFYNLQSKDFREQLLNKFKINHILELSSVRKQIFENADTPVSIIFYNIANRDEIEKNIINYISMKPSPYFEKTKLLLITKSDFKKVSQLKLIEYDYLWKILVYGSYLDFNFIKRLKENKPVDSYITNKGQGVMLGGGNLYDSSYYIGKPFIETRDIEFFILKKSNKLFKEKFVHRLRDKKVFEPPSLLTSQGIDRKSLTIKIAMLKHIAIFTSSITSLKANNIEILYNIMGLYNTSYFKYYILNISSYIGIEREKLLDIEKFNIPFVESNNIIKYTKEIELFQKNHFRESTSNILNYKDKLQVLIKKLDIEVLKAFNLTEQEYALVDYATNIIIPWVIQKNYNVAFSQYDCENQDQRIIEYVKIYTEYFSKLYQARNLYFQATIYCSKYAIAIYFKVLKKKPKDMMVWKREENIENFLRFMNDKSLENLFIQKDIKGFEKDGFYVVKPNEIKNWHKAIGYLDFYEFRKAILKAGKDKWKSLN